MTPLTRHIAIAPEPPALAYARSCGAYEIALFLIDLDLRLAMQHCTTPQQFALKLNEIRAYIANVRAREDERLRQTSDGKRAA